MNNSDFLRETAPYRAYLYRFWRDFFLGRRDEDWRSRMTDAQKIAAVLQAGTDLPEETVIANPLAHTDRMALERAFALAFYGVGETTYPLTKSGAAAPGALAAGPASERAHAIYRAHGLEQPTAGDAEKPRENLPDDHIAVQLEFLACLAEQNHKNEGRFLQEEVLSWLPNILSIVESAPGCEAMRPVLVALEDALQGCAKALGVSSAE